MFVDCDFFYIFARYVAQACTRASAYSNVRYKKSNNYKIF